MSALRGRSTRDRRTTAEEFLRKVADAANSDALDFGWAYALVEVLDEGWVVLSPGEAAALGVEDA